MQKVPIPFFMNKFVLSDRPAFKYMYSIKKLRSDRICSTCLRINRSFMQANRRGVGHKI